MGEICELTTRCSGPAIILVRGSAVPDKMPGPLERAEAIRDRVVRIVFAVGLLFLFLIGLRRVGRVRRVGLGFCHRSRSLGGIT